MYCLDIVLNLGLPCCQYHLGAFKAGARKLPLNTQSAVNERKAVREERTKFFSLSYLSFFFSAFTVHGRGDGFHSISLIALFVFQKVYSWYCAVVDLEGSLRSGGDGCLGIGSLPE